MKCKNCEREDYKFVRKHCTKCYPLILRINKISKGEDKYFISDSYPSEKINKINCEKIRQVEKRLRDLKDSYVLMGGVISHEL